jgi:hypothetical protein
LVSVGQILAFGRPDSLIQQKSAFLRRWVQSEAFSHSTTTVRIESGMEESNNFGLEKWSMSLRAYHNTISQPWRSSMPNDAAVMKWRDRGLTCWQIPEIFLPIGWVNNIVTNELKLRSA